MPSPGAPETGASASDVICRSGCALMSTEPLAELLTRFGSTPFVPSSDSETVTGIELTPAGSVFATVTAKVTEPFAPAASAPVLSVQTDPALLSGRQTQPAVEAPELKVVFGGTVAVAVTPVAPCEPVLANVTTYEAVPPGTAAGPPVTPVSERSGAASTVVASVAVLLAAFRSAPFAPSSDAVAVRDTWVTPDGTWLFTVTASVTFEADPEAIAPTGNVQVAEALKSGVQTQPSVEPPGEKLVFAGIVAVRTTPVAPCVPVLPAVSV